MSNHDNTTTSPGDASWEPLAPAALKRFCRAVLDGTVNPLFAHRKRERILIAKLFGKVPEEPDEAAMSFLARFFEETTPGKTVLDFKNQAALRFAREHFLRGPTSTEFSDAVLGRAGVISRMYPTAATRHAFEQCEAYREIQAMLSQLSAIEQKSLAENREALPDVSEQRSEHASKRADIATTKKAGRKATIPQALPCEKNDSTPVAPKPVDTARPSSGSLSVARHAISGNARTERYSPQELLNRVYDLYHTDPDWVTFFREVLGLEGLVRNTFKSPQMLAQFEMSEEYQEIHRMLAELCKRNDAFRPTSGEPTRVITVRLPMSLYEFLQLESLERHTSLSRLCLSKLLHSVRKETLLAVLDD